MLVFVFLLSTPLFAHGINGVVFQWVVLRLFLLMAGAVDERSKTEDLGNCEMREAWEDVLVKLDTVMS